MNSGGTNSEIWVISALAHRPELFGVFWNSLDASLFVRKLHQTLFNILRGSWVRTGGCNALEASREANDPEAFGVLFEHDDVAGHSKAVLETCFETELEFLKNDRSLRQARSIGEVLATVESVENLRDMSIQLANIVEPPVEDDKTVSVDVSMNEVLEDAEKMLEGHQDVKGVQTKIPKLNKLTGGLSPRKLWIISGETSDGKSVLASNLADSFVDADQAVAIYSWEMPDADITRRMIAGRFDISLNVFTGDEPMDRMVQGKLIDASKWARSVKNRLKIVNASSMNIFDLEADIRIKVIRDNIKCVVIDYLQLIDLDCLDSNREQQISKGCSRLYRLAQSLGFTIIILSQLNDNGAIRESRAPGMDCDVHIKIKKVVNQDGISDETRRDLFIDKNRGGKRFATIPCLFMGEFAKFGELEQRLYDAELEAKKGQPTFRKSFTQMKRQFSS